MNEEVKKTIAEIIRDMKDPRISDMTTITLCEVTSDLKYAKVKISVYDEDEKVRENTVNALNHAAGFISHEVGQRMRIRCVPSIKFSLDTSIEYSVHIGKIINELHRDDPKDEER